MPGGAGDPDRRERSRVVGDPGGDDAADAEGGIGLGIAERHVDPVGRDAACPGEVDVDPVRADRHRRHQIDRAFQPVDPHRVAVGAGLECADRLQRRRLRAFDDVPRKDVEVVDPELVHHLDQPAAADIVAGGEGMEVAHHLDGLPHIRGHDVDQRPVDRSPLREAHDGDVESLLEDIPPVRCHPPSADVDDMAGAGEQRHDPAVAEGGRDEGEVVQMAGAFPRIVGQEHVAFLHRPDGEAFEEVPDRARHRIDMPRRAGDRLGEHPPLGVEHPRRQIARLAGRGGESGPDERLGLFLDHRDQAVPHQLQADRRERVAAGHRGSLAIRILPSASIDAAKDSSTIVVVSSSAITAGPGTVTPGARSPRR